MGRRPVIVGFFCNWCSYRAADAAGVERIQHAPSLRIIRMMCSGRIEPQFVLEAFRQGADGVMIAGCHPGECHYQEGNVAALGRYTLLNKLLGQFGVESQRLKLVWLSASDSQSLVAAVEAMEHDISVMKPLVWPHSTGSHGRSGNTE